MQANTMPELRSQNKRDAMPQLPDQTPQRQSTANSILVGMNAAEPRTKTTEDTADEYFLSPKQYQSSHSARLPLLARNRGQAFRAKRLF